MGQKFATYPLGPQDPAKAQVICQSRKVLIWHGEGLVFGIHHGKSWCACESIQDPIHSQLSNQNNSHQTLQLPRPCKLLAQICVGII